MAGITVRAAGFKYTSGREWVRVFELPVRDEPPPYARIFCARFGCIVPDPDPQTELFEIAAGLLDDDPILRPERHIMIEHKASWTTLADGLPAFDRPGLTKLRSARSSIRSGA
jgi:hypothetical protein